jgi:hypothetical protein
VIVNSGAQTCTLSSERYKHDIQALSVSVSATSSALVLISELKPSSFIYNADQNNVTHWGFIAEQLASTSPELAEYGPDGLPQSIDQPGLIALNTLAIQEQQAEIVSLTNATSSSILATIVSATSSPLLDTQINQPFLAAFVQDISNYLSSAVNFMFARLQATLAVFTNVQTQTLQTSSLQTQTASITNGLQMTDQATGQIYCVTIVNGGFNKVLGACSDANQADQSSGQVSSQNGIQTQNGTQTGTASSTGTGIGMNPGAPVISINGDNPAQVPLNSVYSDLGARIVGPIADLNLGINTTGSVNTSSVGTYTIVYTVTDQNGLTSTSTRIVNVYDPNQQATGVVSTTASTTTASTTTSTTTASTTTASTTTSTISATTTTTATTTATSTTP